MVPRPRKKFQKMTVGRSDSPQNAKSGRGVYLVLEGEFPLHNQFFRTCKERGNRKSITKDAVPQLGLHLNSLMCNFLKKSSVL